MAKHTTRNWILGLAIVGIIAYVAIENPELYSGDTTSATPTLGDGTVTNQATIQVFTGNMNHHILMYDTENPATVYGDDTETTTIIYKKNTSGSYTRMAGGTEDPDGETDSTLGISADILTVYAEISIGSDQNFYVDAQRATDDNPRIGNAIWLDLDNSNRNTYVFPIDVTGYTADPNTVPEQTVSVPLIIEGSLTVDNPNAIFNASTGKVLNIIKFSADMGTSGQGEAVKRIRITMNSTDDTQWYELDSNICWPNGRTPDSGCTKIYFNQMDGLQLASTFQYDWDFGDGDVNTAHMLISPRNGETNFETPIQVYSNFVNQLDGLQVTYEVLTIDAQGATTAVSACVAILEADGASGAGPC